MAGKPENYPPVCANRYRPKTFFSTFERVQPETRHVHIGDSWNRIEPRENIASLLGVLGDDAADRRLREGVSAPYGESCVSSRPATRYITQAKNKC